MAVNVGLVGFGRIGRLALRIAETRKDPNYQITAIGHYRKNPAAFAHLFRNDSVYGRYGGKVEYDENCLVVDGHKVKLLLGLQSGDIDWAKEGVDIVVDASGKNTDYRNAVQHIIKGGAKKVVITAPMSCENEEDALTVVMGINESDYNPKKHRVISNASCTTNGLAPVAKVLDHHFGIVGGLMTTIHAFTNDQQLRDGHHKDLRRARDAASSIIPTTTGAARAVGKVLPKLKGKLNGLSFRVPVPTVSVVDLVFMTRKKIFHPEEINSVLKEESEKNPDGVLGYTVEELVSVDYIGESYSAVVDAPLTMVIPLGGDGTLIKVVAWYDNEWAYTQRTMDLVEYIASREI